jgi:hypothetical protein
VDLAQVVNARYDSGAAERMQDADLIAVREALAGAGLQLRNDDYGRDKLVKLRSMYEPYVHSTARNLMLTLPPWKVVQKTRDNWQAGPWDRLIQARGLGSLGETTQAQAQVSTGEDHF